MTQFTNQTVLVVDDSPEVHDQVAAQLCEESIRLVHAEDALTCARWAREHGPDLLLLDLEMPGTDGLTLARRLKADPEFAHIPMIFLTVKMDDATKVAAFELGAVDYLTKPLDGVELKARVRGALQTKRYYDLLSSKARIDALTGLWSRKFFDDELAREWSLFKRGGVPISVAMIDIDHFQAINDTHGYPFGDSVIQRVADILHRLSRDSDIVCRYGGEEFALILRQTYPQGVPAVGERIREAIESMSLVEGEAPGAVTASVGVTGVDDADRSALTTEAELVAATQQALRLAKENGRNRVEQVTL